MLENVLAQSKSGRSGEFNWNWWPRGARWGTTSSSIGGNCSRTALRHGPRRTGEFWSGSASEPESKAGLEAAAVCAVG